MKQTVLGLVASYRKRGNSEIITKAVARAMGPDWELSLIRLPRLSIKPCRGCYACLIPDKYCLIDDDVVWLLEQIKQARAVIMAAPNYALGPVGVVKMLSDRVLQAAHYFQHFAGIKTGVILTLGLEKYNGLAQTALCVQTASLGLSVVRADSFLGTHPGEAALADDFKDKIEQMAACLTTAAEDRSAGPGQCPRCLSDLFRPHPDGTLECAICKSRARQSGGALDFHYFDPEFSGEGRREHFEWLLGKKLEYETLKERLQSVKNSYPEGDWIRPDAPG